MEYISKDAKINNTEIKPNCKLYKEVDLRNSKLGEYTSIGDRSIIIESFFESNIAINRRNFIQQSKLGRFLHRFQ